MRVRFTLACLLVAGAAVIPAPPAFAAPIVITEFFNTSLAHYVLITDAAEVAAIENGAAGPGWEKTGKTLNAHSDASDAPDLVAVCRFYGSVSPGPNSHFFTADPDECAAVKTDPGWHYEGIAFYVALPAGGECAAGRLPVFRAYNNGFKPQLGINDGNHRFSVDQNSIQKLVDSGWNDEGVVFCAQADDPTVPVRLDVSSASLLLLPGASRNVFVTIEPRHGFAGTVALAVSGLQPGIGGQFAPAIVTLGAEAVEVVLQLSVAASAPPTTGADFLTITATTDSAGRAIAGIAHRIAVAGDPVAVRMAAVAAVEEKCRELSAQASAPLAFLQAVVAFMAARPEYESTGIHADSLTGWGRFRDGTLHVVTNNYESAPPPAQAQTKRRVAQKAGAELPAATKARLMQSFGPAAAEQGPIDSMHGYLTGKGWTVRGSSDAHVGTLKGSKGDGLFYINTHAGYVDSNDPSIPGQLYMIWSSTLVDDQYDAIFADDLKNLRLAHLTANNFKPLVIGGVTVKQRYDTKYSITSRFVDQYMSFANESVVLINACWSNNSPDFVNAFIRKGAGVYLGWTRLLDFGIVSRSAPYFVDRMLGANKYADDKESPPQRAFPYDAVLANMSSKQLDHSTFTGATLKATVKTGLKYPPIFAPSIRYLRVNETLEELSLDGLFGDDKPTVTVGGVPRTVKTWSASSIVTDLPRSGAGSSGNVVVEVRGVKSNVKQLTEWTLPFDYSWTDVFGIPGLLIVGAHPLRFRADIGGYRDAPSEKPKYDAIGGLPTQDSEVTLTGSGSAPSGDCTLTLGGFGTFVSPSSPAASAGQVLASGFKIDGEAKTGILGLAFGTQSPPHRVTVSGGMGCSGSFPVPVQIGRLDGNFSVPTSQDNSRLPIMLPAANLTLDANYEINAKVLVDLGAGGTIRVAWPAVPAKSPPRNTDDDGK